MVLPVRCQIRNEQLGAKECLVSNIFVLQTQQRSACSQSEVADVSWCLLLWPHALLKAFTNALVLRMPLEPHKVEQHGDDDLSYSSFQRHLVASSCICWCESMLTAIWHALILPYSSGVGTVTSHRWVLTAAISI